MGRVGGGQGWGLGLGGEAGVHQQHYAGEQALNMDGQILRV